MLPTVPNPGPNQPERPTITMQASDFDDSDMDAIVWAGSEFASVLSDLAFHEIADPGLWDCYSDGSAEVERLRNALDRMQAAIRAARRELAVVDRRTHRRAARRIQRAGGAA